jgi:hypothetical protein
MARSVTKCNPCQGLLWFGEDDAPPQKVRCTCGMTLLTEEGPVGSFTEPTEEELEEVPQ